MNSFRFLFFALAYGFFLLAIFQTNYEDDFIYDFASCQNINCSKYLEDLLILFPDHYCAFYDLEDDKLVSVIRHGLLFEENHDGLYSHLISVSSKGLMHHKFCVFNDVYVFTGSWNPTTRGTNYNDNYILFFKSKQLASFYQTLYRHLENRTHLVDEPLSFSYDGGSLSAYSCPQHDCQQAVLETISQAKHSIKILAFTFTDQKIIEELISQSRKGINIEVIFEKTRITRYSAYYDFLETNISILLDKNPYTMHEKMFLIDDTTIIVGSYNPTESATTKNDENLLIIRDSSLFALAQEEYHRIRLEAVS